MEDIIRLDSIDQYNKLYGLETDHPLVAVIDLRKAARDLPPHCTINYGLYALFLKQVKCGEKCIQSVVDGAVRHFSSSR